MTVERYILREDKLLDENGQEYISFGIDYPEERISIPDIFLERAKAEIFVKTCNDLDLSPIHLQDVIQDVL